MITISRIILGVIPLAWCVLFSAQVFGEEAPPLFPGSRNPMKKWEVEPITDYALTGE